MRFSLLYRFTRYNNDESDYVDNSNKQIPGAMPRPRMTRAARGQNVNTEGCTDQRRVVEKKEPFRMKKFQNAKAKVFE